MESTIRSLVMLNVNLGKEQLHAQGKTLCMLEKLRFIKIPIIITFFFLIYIFIYMGWMCDAADYKGIFQGNSGS